MEKCKEIIINGLKEGNSRSLAEFLESDRKKILFGQGHQGFICYDMCNRLGEELDFFIGSRKSGRNPVIPKEIPFALCDEFPYSQEEYDVLISVNEKWNDEVREQLANCGFTHVYYSENWNDTNREYRTIFLNAFLRQEMGDAYRESDKVIEWKNFKIWSGVDQPEEYSSMLMGDFFDIIAPSIFGSEEYVREGAYESGEVVIEKDDIVLDLGANIGMFSCVGAAKGKAVYAFEPTPGTRKLLDQQKELYDNLMTEEYAVSNQVGTCMFAVNDMTTDNYNTGGNTLFAERLGDSAAQIEVKTITIDEFVRERGLESVDFIKADIEGAERYMLEGAKETLVRFAPKLSLCTYHLPDDPQVLEELILRYNPNYVVRQGAKKLWAWVPEQRKTDNSN
ncbi:MAG: FkbM family methyltransferase [Lachnospiraceae bacterium]|nr:FkbM family methyltransferase [Lachnospiraceae bacterium]